MLHSGRCDSCSPIGAFESSWLVTQCSSEVGPSKRHVKEAELPFAADLVDQHPPGSVLGSKDVGRSVSMSSGLSCPLALSLLQVWIGLQVKPIFSLEQWRMVSVLIPWKLGTKRSTTPVFPMVLPQSQQRWFCKLRCLRQNKLC